MGRAEGGADGSGGLERFSDARSFCEIYLCAQIRVFLTATEIGADGRLPCFSRGARSLTPSNSHGAWPGPAELTQTPPTLCSKQNPEQPVGKGDNVTGVATIAG